MSVSFPPFLLRIELCYEREQDCLLITNAESKPQCDRLNSFQCCGRLKVAINSLLLLPWGGGNSSKEGKNKWRLVHLPLNRGWPCSLLESIGRGRSHAVNFSAQLLSSQVTTMFVLMMSSCHVRNVTSLRPTAACTNHVAKLHARKPNTLIAYARGPGECWHCLRGDQKESSLAIHRLMSNISSLLLEATYLGTPTGIQQ